MCDTRIDNHCDLLTVREVATKTTLSERTVRALIASGDLPVTRITPGRIAVRRTDLDTFLDARRAG